MSAIHKLLPVFALMLNLVLSPPTSPIEVSVVREDDTAVLRVRDHGVGIAPDMLSRIFEVFTQADIGVHRAQGGLGLALVRALVEQHHGTVIAQSEGPDRGSLFEVRPSRARRRRS